MRTLAGPDASIAFTNLSSATSASLSAAFTDPDPDPGPNHPPTVHSASPPPAGAAQVECHEQGVLALMQSRNIPLERVCLLDPKASLALSPSDGSDNAGKFTWFLFGVRLPSPLSSFPALETSLIPQLFALVGLGLGYPRYVQ